MGELFLDHPKSTRGLKEIKDEITLVIEATTEATTEYQDRRVWILPVLGKQTMIIVLRTGPNLKMQYYLYLHGM